MAAGDIRYRATGGDFANGLTIRTSSGDDHVTLKTLHGDDHTELMTGDGHDDVIVDSFTVDLAALLTIETEAGNDLVDVSASPLLVTVHGAGGADTIYGSEFDDILDGGDQNDIIIGNLGADQIDAGGGNDIVIGDHGKVLDVSDATVTQRNIDQIFTVEAVSDFGGVDTIQAGIGNDVILGGDAGDMIFGETGSDVLVGDNGIVTYDGTQILAKIESTSLDAGGDDILDNGSATVANFVVGGYGMDTITTGTGADSIIGDNGLIDVSLGIVLASTDLDDTTGARDVIMAGDGENNIIGDAGNDDITTGSARDYILGDHGEMVIDTSDLITSMTSTLETLGGGDTIVAGEGDNVVIGGQGDDTITAGSGNDVILGDNGNAKFSSGVLNTAASASLSLSEGGNDIITIVGGKNTVIGGFGTDTITTGAGADTIIGDNGSLDFTSGLVAQSTDLDDLTGAGDIIKAGDGANNVIGGQGADTITAGSGNDVILGDSGDAQFTAGVLQTADSTALGEGGNDIITVSGGDNTVIGGFGTDTINTGTGNDTIIGDNGSASFTAAGLVAQSTDLDEATGARDVINAGDGSNNVIGGAGDDDITTGIGRDYVLGDHGKMVVDANDLITSMTSTLETFGAGDLIAASDGNNVVIGGQGDDTITAGSGNDVILGDSGDAQFTAGVLDLAKSTATAEGGIDNITLLGGANVVIGGQGGDTINTGSGNDTILGDNGDVVFVDGVLQTATSTALNQGGDDIIIATNGNNAIIGGFGMDTITTDAGNDTIIGDNGSLNIAEGVVAESTDLDDTTGDRDIINAGAGANNVIGGAGDDEITTDDGRDYILGDHGKMVIDENGLITSMLSTLETSGAGDTISVSQGDNVVIGGRGADTITAGSGNDVILGDSGDAQFTAGVLDLAKSTATAEGGIDDIAAGDGENVVIGGQGGDTITAGSGNDVILGDSGEVLFNNGLLASVVSRAPGEGGNDDILSGDGDDVVIGGFGSDYINVDRMTSDNLGTDTGADVILGDNGSALFDTQGAFSVLFHIETTDPTDADGMVTDHGGPDFIFSDGGSDVVFGGSGGDNIDAGAGSNIVVGDHGQIILNNGKLYQILSTEPDRGGNDVITAGSGNDTVVAGLGDDHVTLLGGNNLVLGDSGRVDYTEGTGVLKLVESLATRLGGDDQITTGDGHDLIVAGIGNDTVNAANGNNVIVGDNGSIQYNGADGMPLTLDEVKSTAPADGGGDDVITTGAGNDIIIGGDNDPTGVNSLGDKADTIQAGDGNNVVLGDNGRILWYSGQLDLIESTEPGQGGMDVITSGNGNDTVVAGFGKDTVEAGDGDNLVIGDSGRIDYTQGTGATERIETIAPSFGDVDTITTGTGQDIVLGGLGGDFITTNVGQTDLNDGRDLVLGDHGFIDYALDAATGGDATDIDKIESTDTALGGNDQITTGSDSDIVIGGVGMDTIDAGQGASNIVLGDSGRITAASELGGSDLATPFGGHPITLGRIETLSPNLGDVDTITTGTGQDIVLGGLGGDFITTNVGQTDLNDGRDLVLGDHGVIDYALDAATGGDATDIDKIESTDTAFGGDDQITTGSDSDIVIGGVGMDTIDAGQGASNIVLGDSGRITAASELGGSDLATPFGGHPITLGRIETLSPTLGDVDTITTGTGQDIVLGGLGGDFITTNVGQTGLDDGRDLVLGDHGVIDWVLDEARGDGDASDIDKIESTDFNVGGVDTITTGSDSDIIIGGFGGDVIDAGQGDNNIIIGDHGRITAASELDGEDLPTPLDGHPITLGRIETISPAIGGDDTIDAGTGRDIVLGGLGDDTITLNVGETEGTPDGNNLVIGDHGFVDYVFDDADAQDIDLIWSTDTDPEFGGVDRITTGAGNDIILGGSKAEVGDTIAAGDGVNIIIGDSGRITSAVTEDHPDLFSVHELTLGRIETIAPMSGSGEMITTGDGQDIILAGFGDDTISSGGGNDIVIADNGSIHYPDFPQNSFDFESIHTTFPTLGGGDTVDAGSGNDIVLGGAAGDDIHGGTGNDLIFGDQGRVEETPAPDGDLDANLLPLSMLTKPFTFTAIDTQNPDAGGDDLIFGDAGDDIILGQQGSDTVYGGADDDDIIGGHNVAGGHDEGDDLDGGTGDDVIVGDNARVERRGDSLSPRVQVLKDTVIYGETIRSTGDTDGLVQVTGNPQVNPTGVESRSIEIFDHADSFDVANELTHGDDYIAGGAADDVIFGQLGNDIIQGDGSIDLAVSASRLSDGTLSVEASVEDFDHIDNSDNPVSVAGNDGDDYIEGNGGVDTIFGNLGQDDIIGGSSTQFGLAGAESLRPDGSDLIFGGAGTDLMRNNDGDDQIAEGHARDADVIAGDNANVFRLVGINGTPSEDDGNPVFLSFNYDDPAFGYSATLKIIPRAVELLDYTDGGPDFDPSIVNDADGTISDNGAMDEIHGESGDDSVYGQVGDDVLFGEGQDDDLIGGWGRDWISGGTGRDGVLGDDGRIYTSRNDNNDEPLYNIDGFANNELDLEISTPGDLQQATINVRDELKKTVNLTPFNIDPNQDPLFNPRYADDIIYGGLGGDFLHGGAGDDAISGAEALNLAAVEVFPDDGITNAARNDGVVVVTGYRQPLVLSAVETDLGFDVHVLGFAAYRAEEFAAYDEFFPRDKLLVNVTDYFLNFDATEGFEVESDIFSDGQDRIFGDLGNDWLVGGTDTDHIFGGRGNDLLNADDDLETNDVPDGPQASYEDIAYGGAGRDVLIGNTGGDRLIDWAGEFNSYIVPFAPFGASTISRALQPRLFEYLYDLSASDGADPTRASDTRIDPSSTTPVNDTGNDPVRNGAPDAELGLVVQKDSDWHAQTGAPDDPQPGNISGGSRDVLRSANFNTGDADGFTPDSGTWEVSGGRLQVAPESLGGDAVSVYYIDELLPSYFEIEATINAVKPTGGYKSNAYLIFDYQSPTDFKFAGVNISTDKLEMGHRDATGWHVDEQTSAQLKPDTDYQLLLALNGTVATLVVDNSEVFSHVFAPRTDPDGFTYGMNYGMVGIGAFNSRASIDNVAVQVLPPEITLQDTDDFDDGVADLFTGPVTGQWQITGTGSPARYEGAPASGEQTATSATKLSIGSAYLIQLKTTFSTEAIGGVVFDQYSPTDFKFAAVSEATDQVIIGHYTSRHGWTVDAAADRTIDLGTDYELQVILKDSTISVELDGQAVLGHVFNSLIVDGDFGLLTRGGTTFFDTVTVSTDDPTYQTGTPTIGSLSASPEPVIQGEDVTLTANDVADPDGSVAAVSFYRDADGNGTLEVGTDELLGTDTDGGDGWSSVVSTASFPVGTQTYFAQATDNDGLISATVFSTGEVVSSGPVVTNYASGNVAVNITDNNTVTSTIEITDVFSIIDINIQLDIDHSRDADLDVYLVSSSGTRIQLFTDVGGNGDGFNSTILDDDAATSITAGSAPFSGTYRPEGDLSLLEGESLNGTWTLEITDDKNGDTGTLNSWLMIVEH